MSDQIRHMEAAEKAKRELSKVIAEKRVSRALRNIIPAAVLKDFKIGMEVLVYRNEGKVWDSPFYLLDLSGKDVHVNVNRRTVNFPIGRVKEYRHVQGDQNDHA